MGTEPLRQSALSMAIGVPCALAMTSILDFVSACSLACDQTFRAHALALTSWKDLHRILPGTLCERFLHIEIHVAESQAQARVALLRRVEHLSQF